MLTKTCKKQRQQRDLVLGSAMNTQVGWGCGSSSENKPFKSSTSRRKFGNNYTSVCTGALESGELHFPSLCFTKAQETAYLTSPLGNIKQTLQKNSPRRYLVVHWLVLRCLKKLYLVTWLSALLRSTCVGGQRGNSKVLALAKSKD